MTKERINRIHTEAPKYLKEKGYDVIRGSGKTENSLDIHKYKAEKLKDDYERLVELAKQGIYNADKIKSLEKTVNNLQGDNKELKNIRYENRELRNKVKQLSSRINKLNKIIASLSPEFEEEFLKAKDLIENKSKAPKVKTNINQMVR